MAFREIATGQLDRSLNGFAGNNAGNSPTMLMLGGFKFSLNTAVFQEMHRSTSYRWPAQERVGQFDALQFTGPGEDRITLPGIVYPDFRGGADQVESLRKIAAQGKPLRLISASGVMLGAWVIESVEETASAFKKDGAPRRQDFTVTIRKFGDADV
jgi:phage protein U